jgi:hypothetical protein
MYYLLNHISSFVCHQDPTRTLTVASRMLMLCARCTGIYASFLFVWIGLHFAPAGRRWVLSKPSEAAPGALALAVGILLAAAEARELFALPLTVRMLVGAITGTGLALMLRPLFNQIVLGKPKGENAGRAPLATAAVCFVLLALMSLLNIKLVYYILGYGSVLGIVVLYIVANLNVASLVLNGSRGHVTRTRIINLTLFTIGLILTEVLVISVLKSTVLPWLRS